MTNKIEAVRQGDVGPEHISWRSDLGLCKGHGCVDGDF